ncbi:unnamed protein product [Cochlearia groenlandica]
MYYSFKCRHFSEKELAIGAISSFRDKSLIWWNEIVDSTINKGGKHVETWPELKFLMRRKYKEGLEDLEYKECCAEPSELLDIFEVTNNSNVEEVREIEELSKYVSIIE